jgi:hypothetical protein
MHPYENTFKRTVDLGNYTWKHRRRFAYMAFFTMIVATGLCFFWVDESRLDKLDTIITWLYMACASIVGAYMGFSTYASVNGTEGGIQDVSVQVGDSEDDDFFVDEGEEPEQEKEPRPKKKVAAESKRSLKMKGQMRIPHE